MTWESRVPAVLDELVSLWKLTPGLEKLVQDGPLAIEGADMEALAVGHDGSDEGVSTVGDVSPEGYGTKPDRQQFVVNCVIVVLNGAGDIKAARVRAFQILSVAADVLTENHTLGGLVMRAHVQDMGLSQQQTASGSLIHLLFTVSCDGYTAR